ncbi:MAG: metallophosphoesterase, partial [Acidobacteriota bacterium]
MDPIYRFDEVHSVSDLHFGGTPGFQIFNLGATLAKLIDHLRQQPKGRQIALVINGDFVDFLAEAPSMPFDPEGAIAKLDRIAADPAFEPVFAALRRFTRTPDRHLVIALGNHDLELALPWVRERLVELLSVGRASARGRIVLSFDGAGFLCDIGGKRALFVHGNEVDTWNLCDYEHLRRIGRDLTQGNRVEDWNPNAGSRMVIEVMNGIKRDYPFIDLLKPETEAAVPMLLALDPKLAKKIPQVLKVVGRRTWDAGRRRAGFLSGDDVDEDRDGNAEMQRILQRSFTLSDEDVDLDEMLDRVDERMASGEDPFATL